MTTTNASPSPPALNRRAQPGGPSRQQGAPCRLRVHRRMTPRALDRPRRWRATSCRFGGLSDRAVGRSGQRADAHAGPRLAQNNARRRPRTAADGPGQRPLLPALLSAPLLTWAFPESHSLRCGLRTVRHRPGQRPDLEFLAEGPTREVTVQGPLPSALLSCPGLRTTAPVRALGRHGPVIRQSVPEQGRGQGAAPLSTVLSTVRPLLAGGGCRLRQRRNQRDSEPSADSRAASPGMTVDTAALLSRRSDPLGERLASSTPRRSGAQPSPPSRAMCASVGGLGSARWRPQALPAHGQLVTERAGIGGTAASPELSPNGTSGSRPSAQAECSGSRVMGRARRRRCDPEPSISCVRPAGPAGPADAERHFGAAPAS